MKSTQIYQVKKRFNSITKQSFCKKMTKDGLMYKKLFGKQSNCF